MNDHQRTAIRHHCRLSFDVVEAAVRGPRRPKERPRVRDGGAVVRPTTRAEMEVLTRSTPLPALLDRVERYETALRDIAYDEGGECDYGGHDGPRNTLDQDLPRRDLLGQAGADAARNGGDRWGCLTG